MALCTLKLVRLTRSRLASLCLYSLASGFPLIQSTSPIPLLCTYRFIGRYHLYNTAHHIKIYYVAMYKSPRVYAIIRTRNTFVLLSTCDFGHVWLSILWLSRHGQHYCLATSALLSLSHFSCICFFFLQITHSLLVTFCQLGCGEKCAVLVPQCLYTIITNKVLEHQFRCVTVWRCA